MVKSEVSAGQEEPATVVAIKMDKTTIIISAVVGSLGLLSAILGFAAEGAKLFLIKLHIRCDLDLYGFSVSSNSSAVGLGVCAAIFLLITQVTVAAIGGCCKSRAIPSETETKPIVGVVCAVFSWVAAVIAFVLFLDGAIVESTCVLVPGGLFAAAGVLTLIATGLGMTSYFMLRTQPEPNEPAVPARPPAPEDDEPTPIVGVPMGPGFSPVPPNPLLVPNPQFAHPATPPPQGGGYVQAPPNPQFAAAAAAQGYELQAPNQQYFPAHPQGHARV
ncbi:hypothetical protein E2562_017195 [Oryza meyeriana var. granulata]|uniref:Uncharacterized protein n=1 Tax=Oryza meyeriana var. granulata TaxID=110450 RepID=A0A6G1ELN0_9ORYZ|nr:hypothetical protein E2562_017195 [Oryza meyeriana var. granulata]